ncbi:RNA-directed DNA polymerase [Nitrosomonas halophila]|uniref:Reverse transcriptase (RNA-dependent DNA polymerase) n=1 Tax=Nitrosomonas halophila TaxID=44576 RepID=A0A1H3LF88_9PROT|nr:RNA-directed DNA polymerase [Nitrosomonas halophila]SDY62614.1 Reverse transcriptase (RNA-dependent DNA polymerase) [Nitrosomonas halophila]
MITLEELILAWLKAKVDLYYSTNPPLMDMADYEDGLLDNIGHLLQRINGEDQEWITAPEFLGTWTLAPKAITFPKEPKKQKVSATQETTLIFAAPDAEWASRTGNGEQPTAEFRLMAHCSIDFHVFSALWMMLVGHHFDKKLGDNVYGSRLRRNGNGDINRMALGSFKPYLKPFRDWRDGAIKAMRSALSDKKDVIALAADVSSFYHRLNPGFMLDAGFHQKAGATLNEDETRLNRLFITALQAWAKNTPLQKGLPVGLPASAVVANAALIELDQFIDRQVVPLYYGRYVDDILLVMHNTSKFTTSKDFWNWVINRDGGKDLLELENGSIVFKPSYLTDDDSDIAFKNTKNKLFVLSGGPGRALVNAISEQINQRASEWRALPDLPDNPGTIATDLLKATNHAGEQADNLRKADALTLHRAGFALNLRDYEAFERDLPPDAWQAHRHAFFEAVIDHLLTPVKFFELAQYLPRIARMATACVDFKHLGKILKQLQELGETIHDQCIHQIKASRCPETEVKQDLHRWQNSLANILAESILSVLPPRLSATAKKDWQNEVDSHWHRLVEAGALTAKYAKPLSELQKLHACLFSHDLAHIPLRFSGLPKEMLSQRGIPARKKLINANWRADDARGIGDAIETLAGWFKPKLANGIPPGLYFATRPFSLNELFLITPQPFNRAWQPNLGKVICALRGFEPSEYKMPHWDKQQGTLQIPDGEPKASQTIAVSSWETRETSFVAAVMHQPDPDSRRRYQRLNRLINELIAQPDHTGYLILPELAMPPRWFMRIAGKLNGRRISLITGVEYLHASKKRVHNQIWASLTHDGLGFPSLMLYRQDKQTPALHEEQELFRLAGASLKPAMPWKWQSPPIIRHGNFHFALLNCSELTNIRYRAELRGKVDALFVPEWNSDTDTFNALVESAALDIHAYIIQCNNRQYGDSRIRAPYKDRWKRDLLRVKGGNHDYCITGQIDVQALREFQSSHRSPGDPFKPVPDGFNDAMDHNRRVLPEGNPD